MTRDEFIEQTLREAKDFVKQVRNYLYAQEQEAKGKPSPLYTPTVDDLWAGTHAVHQHCVDALMWLNEK